MTTTRKRRPRSFAAALSEWDAAVALVHAEPTDANLQALCSLLDALESCGIEHLCDRIGGPGGVGSAPGPGPSCVRGTNMTDRTCSVEGCVGAPKARGWCGLHYARWQRHGDPLSGGPARLASTPENFWLRTEAQGRCVVWTGYTGPDGYGSLRWRGRTVIAHRLAFYLRMGRWPAAGAELRHLCNNPPCVLHAVEGTRSENVRDAVAAKTHVEARKTHCAKGHPFDRRTAHGRVCSQCARERGLAYYHRTKAPSKLKVIDWDRAAALYLSGLSTPEVGRIMELNASTIYRGLKRHGVPLRSLSESQRLKGRAA